MSIYKKDNKFISYLVILLSLFVLVLFTKTEVMNMQENFDAKDTVELELQAKTNELSELNEIEKKLKKDDSATKRYEVSITEDKLMNYFYGYIETIDSQVGSIGIKSISISEEKENELGFLETSVTLSLNVSNEAVLKQFLDFTVQESADYQFFIDSFFFPTDWREGGFSVNLPLKLYYK